MITKFNSDINGIYFMTTDEIFHGTRKQYKPIEDPCHVESVVIFVDQPFFTTPHLWKITRYWTNVLIKQIFQPSFVLSKNQEEEEWELYDLEKDPSELVNLASTKHRSSHEKLFDHLSKILHLFHSNVYKTQTTPQITAKL